MLTNVLEYLDMTAERIPERIAFADESSELSFCQFQKNAKGVGTWLLRHGFEREPVIVYMRKSPDSLAAYFGAVYGGCFYVPVDEEMPERRIELILKDTQAGILICDEETENKIEGFEWSGMVVRYRTCIEEQADETALREVRRRTLDVDPVCIFYTSGSTGVPKGVVCSHRGIIDYVEHLSETLGFDENCVFANQTPLYWDASMKEIYATLKHGAVTWLVPKNLFVNPQKLVEYLNRHRINTICWVVSALTMISAFGTFELIKPQFLKLVAFCGEVFPVRQFNIWKSALPDAEFYNLYGPTEATGVSTYYHAERLFRENEVIPIGKPFANTQVLLLDEEGNETAEGMTGEICIRGAGVTLGYYRNEGASVYIQNPRNSCYYDRIYRTGDLGRWDSDGNLIFVSRKDHQIKHMGHRIELGEIEADVKLTDGVDDCCCVFIRQKNKIVLFYKGAISKGELTQALRSRLPRYMLPNAVILMERIPLTANGKKDRMKMKEIYLEKTLRTGGKSDGRTGNQTGSTGSAAGDA